MDLQLLVAILFLFFLAGFCFCCLFWAGLCCLLMGLPIAVVVRFLPRWSTSKTQDRRPAERQQVRGMQYSTSSVPLSVLEWLTRLHDKLCMLPNSFPHRASIARTTPTCCHRQSKPSMPHADKGSCGIYGWYWTPEGICNPPAKLQC